MKKKIIVIITLLAIFFFLLFYFLDKHEDRIIDEFWEKVDLIIIGMNGSEVIKILGTPQNEMWVETNSLDNIDQDIKKKYKKILILTFCPKTILTKECSLGIEIYLDKKGGKVISIAWFMM